MSIGIANISPVPAEHLGEPVVGNIAQRVSDTTTIRTVFGFHPGAAVGGVCRDLLVADVVHLDALVHAAVMDVDDVAAAQREDHLYAFGLECLDDEMTSRDSNRPRRGLIRIEAVDEFGAVDTSGRARRALSHD